MVAFHEETPARPQVSREPKHFRYCSVLLKLLVIITLWVSKRDTYRNTASCLWPTFAQAFTFYRRYSGPSGKPAKSSQREAKNRETSHSRHFRVFETNAPGRSRCRDSSRRRNRENPLAIYQQSLFDWATNGDLRRNLMPSAGLGV